MSLTTCQVWSVDRRRCRRWGCPGQ